ncbi:MAG: C40 family peptidase [Cytophagales bacterium]|nr:C40 family peptidase [Cytophagales bacterium]
MPTPKGTCLLTVIPVRAEARDEAEIVTQAIFGDTMELIERHEKPNWIKIRMCFDGCEGWIDPKQLTLISETHFQALEETDRQTALDLSAKIQTDQFSRFVSAGASLPFQESELFEQKLRYFGKSKAFSERWSAKQLVEYALQFEDAPYLWGGKTVFGIDCSGFTQIVFKAAGYKLLRNSYQQAKQGSAVRYGEQQIGDLLFFDNDRGKIIHVGLAVSEREILHASGQMRIDSFDAKGIFRSDWSKYTHRLCTIRRIIT